jgi:hypothetical protein
MNYKEALADERPTNPEIGPLTFEIVHYQDSGYRFKIIGPDEEPPSGFEQPGFDETGFDIGNAAFGSGGGCPLQPTVQTPWPVNSQLLVRRVVSIPAGATNVRVIVSVDNDIVGVFFNGTPISGSISHDGCPIRDEFRFDVPPELVQSGENLVAFHVLDRGAESFFDTRILAELSADQLLGAVAVQQAPLVPVRDVVVGCRVDPDGRRSTTIAYALAATGEFDEIRLGQMSEDTLTAETLLGGERTAFATATPDVMTMSRSFSATERLGNLDPAILSVPSVFANQTALEGMIFCSGTPEGSSCEEACNRKAGLASIGVDIGGAVRIGGIRGNKPISSESLLVAAADTIAKRGIEKLRKQCVAGCMKTPPDPVPDPCAAPGAPPPCPQPPKPMPPAPGTLSGAFIFDAAGTQPFDQTVIFSGRLAQGLGGTGMTNFVVQKMERLAPGPARGISFSAENLTAGSWQVTANPLGIAFPQTCFNVRVPPGGLGFIRINISGGQGLRCE